MKAIGIVELSSMAKGIEVWDAMLKATSVELVTATTLCPGKYMILIKGDVAAVTTSVETGIKLSKSWFVDSLIIPNINNQIFPAITGSQEVNNVEALGIVETFSVASGIIFADGAAKAASVTITELQIAMGLGGKSTIYLTGEVGAVEAAIAKGKNAIDPHMLVDCNIIPSPHPDLKKEFKE